MNNDIPGLRQQLQQLLAQHTAGTLDAAAYAAAKDRLERQLLDQVMAQPELPSSPPRALFFFDEAVAETNFERDFGLR